MTRSKIRTSGAEGLTLSSTALTVANGLTLTDGDIALASGHGVSFAATSDGATMTGELLDDYEEGTWTPTNNGDSTGTVSANAKYVKIGRQVTCHATISVPSGGGFSADRFGGLPFSPVHDNTLSAVHSCAVVLGGNVKMVTVNNGATDLTTRDVNGNAVNPGSSQICRFTIVYQIT